MENLREVDQYPPSNSNLRGDDGGFAINASAFVPLIIFIINNKKNSVKSLNARLKSISYL